MNSHDRPSGSPTATPVNGYSLLGLVLAGLVLSVVVASELTAAAVGRSSSPEIGLLMIFLWSVFGALLMKRRGRSGWLGLVFGFAGTAGVSALAGALQELHGRGIV